MQCFTVKRQCIEIRLGDEKGKDGGCGEASRFRLYGPGRGEKKMRDQTDKREKVRHKLVMHPGIAALRGRKADTEGGERKGAILMSI